jgi:hypothetical protein
VRLSIQKSALADLRQGFRFYEKKAPGLGNYFLDSIYSDIDSLLLYAGIHPIHFGKFRARSERFPFAIYYEIENQVVLVKAVLDMRRDPNWIKRKLKRLK